MYKEHRSLKAKLSWNSLISPTEAQFDLRTFERNYKSKKTVAACFRPANAFHLK